MFIEVPCSEMSIIKRKPVHGFGINDADYKVTIKDESGISWCPYYKKWMDMIKRCYSAKYKESNPSYRDCKVSDEWLIFSNFKAWMKTQDWHNKELDKDILCPDNKIYSSKTCVFIPHSLNALLIHKKVKAKLPAGVYFHKAAQKYCAEIKISLKKNYLGLFNTIEDANEAYKKAKRKEILKCANIQTNIKIRDGLIAHAEAL